MSISAEISFTFLATVSDYSRKMLKVVHMLYSRATLVRVEESSEFFLLSLILKIFDRRWWWTFILHKCDTGQNFEYDVTTQNRASTSLNSEFRLTIPSRPWGNNITKPDCRTHFAWPELMNWSIMHWAVLLKSPNWASQQTRAFGLVIENPSSNPGRNITYRISEIALTEI